jgi:hypothetical protein
MSPLQGWELGKMPWMWGLFTVGVSFLGFIADYLDIALTSRREFLPFAPFAIIFARLCVKNIAIKEHREVIPEGDSHICALCNHLCSPLREKKNIA